MASFEFIRSGRPLHRTDAQQEPLEKLQNGCASGCHGTLAGRCAASHRPGQRLRLVHYYTVDEIDIDKHSKAHFR